MLRKIVNKFIVFLDVFIISSLMWVQKNCQFSSFNEILYTITFSIGNASKDLIYSYVKTILLSFIVITLVLILMYLINKILKNNNTYINLFYKSKKITINLFDNVVIKLLSKFGCLGILIVTIFYSLHFFYVFDYIKNSLQYSNFFKENYVNPKNVSIEFEDEKRNLIYIYLESMESTYADKKTGGNYEKNYIKELSNLANKNINFSATSKLGGAYQVYGTTWTIGAMIGSTAGIPYKTFLSNDGNIEYEMYSKFLPGAYTLGEILEDFGYKNYIMFGSDAEFGGRKTYFQEHGNYEIYDYYSAKKDNIIDEDYYVFWGYEDDILFKYAKEKLLEISKNAETFNFTLLTVDSHFPDGYMSEFCEKEDDNQYLNAISCSSKQVNSFIKWIQKQDFYQNTTIVIIGDHLSMNNYSFDNIRYYDRSIYNTFINSAVNTDCEKGRIFNTFDIYPTVLASLGANIDGNKLALGTNLFSCDATLSEIYDYAFINKELSKNSEYYIKCINSNMC